MNTLVASIMWLNMATFDYSVSFPTQSYDDCRAAMAEYATSNLPITFLSCDRKPLPDADNLKRPRRK